MKKMVETKLCSINGCRNKHYGKGLCKLHYMIEYNQRPKIKERGKEYLQRPEVKEHRNEYYKEYNKRPKTKERIKRYYTGYNQRPEIKEHHKKYYQQPEIKERMKKHNQEVNAKKHFGLSREQYNEKIKDGCVICGFKEVIDLHHKNFKGKKDNSDLVALCPNHHQMIHRNHITFEQLKELTR